MPWLLHVLRTWLRTSSWFSVFSTTGWGGSLLKSAKAVTTRPSVSQIPRWYCCSPFMFLRVFAFLKKSPFCSWGEGAKLVSSICHLYLEVGVHFFFKNAINDIDLSLERFIPYNSTSRLLGIYPKEITRNMGKSFHLNVHCSVIYKAKNWKQPKCSTIEKWFWKWWYIHMRKY